MENLDLNFRNLNRHQVLNKYVECLRQLRELADQTCNIRALHFDNYVLFQYFQQRRSAEEFRGTESSAVTAAAGNYGQQIAFIKTELLNQLNDRKRKILYWLFYMLLVFLCVSYKNEATTAVVRNIQTFIYPGMKMWRKMTLPVIKLYPGLTELYDESCLMMNPFFQVEDLNCEPCANIQNVHDLTDGEEEPHERDDYSSSGESSGGRNKDECTNKFEKTPSKFVPFLFKINQDPVHLNDFYNIYTNNYEIFQRDAFRVQSTSRDITNLEELFHQLNHSHTRLQQLYPASTHSHRTTFMPIPALHQYRGPSQQTHNMWRCNRMLPARMLRRLFERPKRLPRTGIALERYVTIDTAHAPSYTLPDTECANVYVQQVSGARFIILRPTTECRHRCRTLSVRLPQSFVLSYNWWYWKPISAPDPMADTLSISLIGSYC